MISYDKVKDNAALLLALTSLTSSEFEKLLGLNLDLRGKGFPL